MIDRVGGKQDYRLSSMILHTVSILASHTHSSTIMPKNSIVTFLFQGNTVRGGHFVSLIMHNGTSYLVNDAARIVQSTEEEMKETGQIRALPFLGEIYVYVKC